MKTLNDFLQASQAENLYDTNGELVTAEEYSKEVIVAYNKYMSYLNQETCAICDKELTHDDRVLFTSMDFNRTCKQHREYAYVFQRDMIRNQLGIKPRI